MITAPERCEEQTVEEQIILESRIRAHGHLALVEWEEASPRRAMAKAQKYSDPVRRSVFDRLYDNSIIVLLVVTIAAVVASLAHL